MIDRMLDRMIDRMSRKNKEPINCWSMEMADNRDGGRPTI